MFSPFHKTETLRRRVLTLGALSAGLLLTAGLATGPASAAVAAPAGSGGAAAVKALPAGGYAGSSYTQDVRNLTPAAGLDSAAVISPAAAWGPKGIDVSVYQGSINWTEVKAAGISFAYIRATEGSTYRDPDFSANYLNAYYAKVIRGAYTYAVPSASSGATQATYFAEHGGAWSADNLTLPGMLDLEGGCYGMSKTSMDSWILSFYNTYKSKTGRDVVIYTSPNWWDTCTGGWSGMSTRSPLYVADWTSASSPTIPSGFPYATLWQYTDAGSVSGISGAVDRDRFNGSAARLLALANNT